MTARIIDIETTGTDPARDAIVEIASVDEMVSEMLARRTGHEWSCRRSV
jgi:oligoribonuclease (3'-5' exoribonuclease)